MDRRQRKNSLRLQGYDYAKAGAYFVTINAYRGLRIFGHIDNGIVILSALGTIIENCWHEIPEHYPAVELDASVVMPNHLHGIIVLHDEYKAHHTLGQIIGTFKGAVTRIAKQSQLEIDLEHPIWHRNFHDRVIRNEQEYRYIAHYVQTNPARWEADSLNK